VFKIIVLFFFFLLLHSLLCARVALTKYTSVAQQKISKYIEQFNPASIAQQLNHFNKKLRNQLFRKANKDKRLEAKWQKNIVTKERSLAIDNAALFKLKKYTNFSKAAPIPKAAPAYTKIVNDIPGLDSLTTVLNFIKDNKGIHNTLSTLKTINIYT
jgi:hypothetical protein